MAEEGSEAPERFARGPAATSSLLPSARLVFATLSLTASAAGADQAPTSSPRNSVYLRGGSSSIVWIIYTRNLGDFGKPTLTLGLAPHPYNDYREYFAGAGVNLNRTHEGIAPTVLFTHTTDGNQIEYWLSPWLDKDRFALQTFIGGYVPLRHAGVYQVFFDPVTLLYKLSGRVAVGATYTDTRAQHADPVQAAGPAFQLTIPKGVLIVDALKGISHYDDEVRATVLLAF